MFQINIVGFQDGKDFSVEGQIPVHAEFFDIDDVEALSAGDPRNVFAFHILGHVGHNVGAVFIFGIGVSDHHGNIFFDDREHGLVVHDLGTAIGKFAKLFIGDFLNLSGVRNDGRIHGE